MFSFQSQTAKSASWKYHGHWSSGVGPPWLPVPGTWEGSGRKCSDDHRPFHQLWSGICNKNPNSTNDGKDPMGQIYCPLWSTQKDFNQSGMKFWESVGGWPLWVDGGVEDMDQSISSADQWSMWKVQLHSDQYAWDFAQGKEVRVEEPIGTLVHAYNCTWNSATGFSPYYLMFGRQPHLPVNVALGLAPCTITEPNTTKFIQKLRERTKWAYEKAEAFQAKEAQRHKHNYDRRSRAVALEVRDTVLVHVTTFKGHHKMQDRWENREYVVEKQPYPNVTVYVVCPRDGEGHSQTLHRNYLLPINSNMGQDKADGSEERVKSNTSPTPAPSADSSMQDSLDWPAPVRCSTQTTRNQLPWRYQNFGLSAGTGPTSIRDAWADLCVWLF